MTPSTILLALFLTQDTSQPLWIAPEVAPCPDPIKSPAWIWLAHPDQPAPTPENAPAETIWLSQVLPVPRSSPTTSLILQAEAHLSLAADNHAVAFWNGEEVLRCDDWSRPAQARLQLAPGPNVLAIQATNDKGAGRNPAGVAAVLSIREDPSSRSVPLLITDATWRGTFVEWPGWPAEPAPRDSPTATVVCPLGSPPWGLSASAFLPPRACPILRRGFNLDAAPAAARVRIIGLGHYELRVNGQRVGDSLINQSWSQYDRTLYWQEFDIAPFLQRGSNMIGVLLGDSFWRVDTPNDANRFAKTDAMPDFSRGHPYLLWLDATIDSVDGQRTTLVSDTDWKWTAGPLTFSHIYAGEDFDARAEPAGWDRPGFADTQWKLVQPVTAPPAALEPLKSPPIKAFEVFHPTEIREPDAGVYTYVFPQNCSALLRFVVAGKAGQTVRFKPCEYMDASGRVKFTYTWGTNKDIWHDYTLRGGAGGRSSGARSAGESHQTLFCYVGCQYVEVTGAVPAGRPNPHNLPVLKSLELVHVRAANRGVGEFTCSSDLQNAAQRLIDWSIRSNMSYFPTDCPHREKNGWQEQNWHMARALSYRYDVRDYLRRVGHDLRDTQLADGHVPTNCPNYLVAIGPHGFWNEAPEWGIAAVLVPWHVYEWYGDRDALADNFDSMKRYVDYLATQAKDGVINSNLGDWYDYGHGKGDGPSQWTPTQVSATAIWALGASTVACAASVLERPDDAARYQRLFEQIRGDFQRHFYDPTTKAVTNKGSCQAAHAVALCANLIPDPDRPAVLDAILADLEKRNWQQTTGEVLQVFLIRALADADYERIPAAPDAKAPAATRYADALHRVFAREDRGGYGYMVKSGLTTLPESWDAKPGTGNSMNHFMLGHLMEWHFAYVAGIRQQPGGVGWKKILIAPLPGPPDGGPSYPSPIDRADAAFDSPAGRIESHWKQTGDEFELRVVIPQGADAVAFLPDGSLHVLSSGETTLRCRR